MPRLLADRRIPILYPAGPVKYSNAAPNARGVVVRISTFTPSISI